MLVCGALIIVLSLGITGCGSNDEEAGQEAAPTSSVTPVPLEETAEPTTAPPAEVTVPDVHGMYPDKATDLLRAAGLAVDTKPVKEPTDPAAAAVEDGQVYSQNPAAGTTVPGGTTVEVFFRWDRM
jgi:beta-lactam-binding protein with PASTA domain